MLENLRQRCYPREFRIAPPCWPAGLRELLERAPGPPGEAPPPDDEFDERRMSLLADVGTGLWRMKQKMVKTGTTQPVEEMRRPFRHLESVWDALTQAGVEIQDHTDMPFDPGMSIRAIAVQPVPGLGRERVIETIKPSIYYKGKTIQMGEVIVGRPEDGAHPPQS